MRGRRTCKKYKFARFCFFLQLGKNIFLTGEKYFPNWGKKASHTGLTHDPLNS